MWRNTAQDTSEPRCPPRAGLSSAPAAFDTDMHFSWREERKCLPGAPGLEDEPARSERASRDRFNPQRAGLSSAPAAFDTDAHSHRREERKCLPGAARIEDEPARWGSRTSRLASLARGHLPPPPALGTTLREITAQIVAALRAATVPDAHAAPRVRAGNEHQQKSRGIQKRVDDEAERNRPERKDTRYSQRALLLLEINGPAWHESPPRRMRTRPPCIMP